MNFNNLILENLGWNFPGTERIRVSNTSKKLTGRPPDFLCIGAQKAGTTWFSENISCHPDVWMPPVKEIQYFNHIHIPEHRNWTNKHRDRHAKVALREFMRCLDINNINWLELQSIANIGYGELDDAWYLRNFIGAGHVKLCGEATPEYSLLDNKGIQHVKSVCPNAKIIIFLRDPILRSWSHIRMLNKNSNNNISIDEAVHFNDVANRSQYCDIIEMWNNVYGKERIHVDFYDFIAEEPGALMRRICTFLNIDYKEDYFKSINKVIHKGVEIELPDNIHGQLKERLRGSYEKLLDKYPEIGKKWYEKHYA